jgi:hypothetical protein
MKRVRRRAVARVVPNSKKPKEPAGRPPIHDPKRRGSVTARAAPTMVEIVVRTPLMVKR